MPRALCILALFCWSAYALNNRPVIGILSQPRSGYPGKAYIAASYVKYVENAGARAVPLHYNMSESEVRRLVRSVNGVLFPGGSTDLAPGHVYTRTVHAIVDEVQQLNAQGTWYPLWGTCMGFQHIAQVIAGDLDILEGNFDSWNYPIPLNFTGNAASSRLMASASQKLWDLLSTEKYTMNNHHFGIRPTKWDKTAKLTSMFTVVATNMDTKGKEFVSMYEGHKMPIYGAQWHPEKNAFEWVNEDIPHTSDAIEVAQYFANFLVNEARKNNRAFAGGEKELQKYLVYNYAPIYIGKDADASFEQIYIF